MALQNKIISSLQTEDLQHQIVKTEIEKLYDTKLNINIINYVRFQDCFQKILESNKSIPIDILLFQIRGHYYLDLVKIFGWYVNEKKKWVKTINILAIKKSNHEKLPPEWKFRYPRPASAAKEFIKRKKILLIVCQWLYSFIMRFLNLYMGYLVGNE